MIIVKLKGGLGNQMFQYALGRTLSQKLKVELGLDISWFQTSKDRKYSLDAFSLPEKILRNSGSTLQDFINTNHTKTVSESSFEFDKEILNAQDNVCLDGYWQSEKYFSSESATIRKDFTLSTISAEIRTLGQKITSGESISVHIRRGDYISNAKFNQVHGVLPTTYYESAIKLASEGFSNPNFYIFSDDPTWAEKNLNLRGESTHVSKLNFSPAEEMFLMGLAKRNIIANSSFSWWGAWLNANPDKMIVAPKQWFSNSTHNTKDLIPSSWLTL